MSSERVLHPKHGPHNPSVFTPSRRPNSVRRTTTHDSLRPDGLLGDVHLVATGRDLRTDADGQATVVATARLDATIEYIPERQVTTISVDPPAEGIERLVGVRASSGFRQAVDDNVPDARTHSLRYQLLDDVPTALLVSGYTIGAGGVSMRPRGGLRLQHPDLCAGWATGGTILVEMEASGQVPMVTGPEAPSLRRDDDDLAWHQLSPLPAHGMRRSRRLDVWEGKGVIAVECFFRDSHFAADGLETVVHEYTVDASIDPETRRFLSCDTTVGALPWIECPGAVGSSERLIGAPAEGLRPWVRETFVGPTTCTHLNDTLRSLEGVPDLLAILTQDGLS